MTATAHECTQCGGAVEPAMLPFWERTDGPGLDNVQCAACTPSALEYANVHMLFDGTDDDGDREWSDAGWAAIGAARARPQKTTRHLVDLGAPRVSAGGAYRCFPLREIGADTMIASVMVWDGDRWLGWDGGADYEGRRAIVDLAPAPGVAESAPRFAGDTGVGGCVVVTALRFVRADETLDEIARDLRGEERTR